MEKITAITLKGYTAVKQIDFDRCSDLYTSYQIQEESHKSGSLKLRIIILFVRMKCKNVLSLMECITTIFERQILYNCY